MIHPKCNVCVKSFPTPMSYEKHLCTLKHLRTELEPNQKVKEDDDDNSEFDPSEFVTLDEVGSDDEEDEDQENEEKYMEADHEVKESSEEISDVSKKDLTWAAKQMDEIKDVKLKEEEVKEEPEEVKQEIINNEDEDDEIEVMGSKSREEPVMPVIEPDTPVGLDYIRQVVMFYCDLCHKCKNLILYS